ncbi:MAG: PIN domain-containing protein [Nanoarchaeota archaeon]|nr:PIN domain-containing protein [Nanoarchaeota archaeon]
MKKRYLIDTCIWRDFYENRFSKSGKPLGEYASKLFLKILKNKNNILFSETLILELKIDYSLKEINFMLQIFFFNNALIKIKITPKEYKEAKNLSMERELPLVDCLTAILARNYNAQMISQDKHFFINLKDIVKTIKPQEVN